MILVFSHSLRDARDGGSVVVGGSGGLLLSRRRGGRSATNLRVRGGLATGFARCGGMRRALIIGSLTEMEDLMGSAGAQGPLWGARARDWAELAEPAQTPFYDAVFDEIKVGPGTRLLDVGCGAGLALTLAAKRGAVVAGLDAAEGLLVMARERLPEDDIRVGDLEELPYADATFTAATSFNAVQYAIDPVRALRELARVRCPARRSRSSPGVIRRGRRCGRCWARSAGCCPRRRRGRAARSRSAPLGPWRRWWSQPVCGPGRPGRSRRRMSSPTWQRRCGRRARPGPRPGRSSTPGSAAGALTAVMARHRRDEGEVRLDNVFRYLIAWT